MTTTADVIKIVSNMLKEISKQKDFVLPAGRNLLETPQIYQYFLPLNLKKEYKNSPYIVVGFGGEEQELWESTDESDLKINLTLGFCADDEDLAENVEILLAALEKIELFLKDNAILDGTTMLKKIKKLIPKEQPIPYLEGQIMLEYSYYKPVAVEEP